MKPSLLKTTSAFVLAASAAFAGQAQDAAEDTELRAQTITVTATRRAESVQDIPLNIAAVGSQQIEEQGFSELADVLAYIPGINIVDRGGRQGNPIIVRGLNADPIGPGDGNNDGGGTVATYLGEIPIFLDLKLNDLERVEVLLGPQGTLYGAGTLGGAIRYIPNRPSFDGDMANVRAEAYQYSEADDLSTGAGFTINKTVTDKFALRGSFDFKNDSGFTDYPFLVREIGVSNPDIFDSANLRGINDADGEEAYSGRIAARWRPLDWLDGTLTYYFQNQDIEGRTISSARSTIATGDYESAKRVTEPNFRRNQLLALEVVADLGFAELTSATGFGKHDEDGQRDQTDLLISLEYSYELFPAFTSFTREKDDDEFLNQELRLVSTTDGPLNWIVGAYYNKAKTSSFSKEFTPGYSEYAIDVLEFDDIIGLTGHPADLEYFSTDRQELTETAFFGEVGYDITDRWTVTVGGRYYDYELKAASTVDFPLFDDTLVPLTIDEVQNLAFDPALGQADDGFLYKFNTSYDLTDDALVYFTISEGYRIGASNGIGECDAYDPDATQGACALAPGQQFGPNAGDVAQFDERQFGPDQTTSYELGAKTTLMDGALILNGAVYFIDWTDPQVSSATVNANIPITINADGAESKGFEISGNWQATRAFSLRGSYSHTETELTADVPSLIRTITPPGFGTAFEDGLSGDRLPGSPEDQFAIFASYEQPFRDATLVYNFGYSYQGDILTRTGGRGNSLTLDGFGLANASVVYDADTWKATLYATNLFDEFAETGVVSTSLSNQTVSDNDGGDVFVRSYYTTVAPPRAIGVRFSYTFE
jgi:outer membrane receptor protein involved in Fe transport